MICVYLSRYIFFFFRKKPAATRFVFQKSHNEHYFPCECVYSKLFKIEYLLFFFGGHLDTLINYRYIFMLYLLITYILSEPYFVCIRISNSGTIIFTMYLFVSIFFLFRLKQRLWNETKKIFIHIIE